MTVKRLFIDEAHKQALKSDMNFNHGAVLVYRGKIIGRG
jgi:pyrimidine deaminase RibD-like protein